MPRGSKKRKAAKKKMENQSNNHSNPASASTHSHGDEDVKHHDEKDSDVGEVSSPGSQDHHNPSTEGEEDKIEKKKNFSNLPSSEESKIKESVVHVEREFKIEGKSDGKNGRVVKHDEAMRKSYNGRNFSSSGNSSDDEVHGIKNSLATEDKVYHLSEMSAEAIHSVEVKKQVEIESLLEEKNEKKPSYVEGKFGTSLEKNEKAIVQTDDRLALPYNEPRGANDNQVEQEKECAVTEPLLVPSPCPEKRTSWKSCCGLFELFSGSGR